MNLQPEVLSKIGYKIKAELNHQALIPFVKKYINKKTRAARLYNLLNLLFLSSIIMLFVFNHYYERLSFGQGLLHTSYGFSIAFLLIPIHEYIHAVAYRYLGAPSVSYDANWKKFYFMAIADKFVVNQREFQIVALAPFVTITVLSSLMLIIVNTPWDYTILGLLLTHTAFCSGDFGLLSYFETYPDSEIVTYDDKENGMSYFLEKES